MHSLIIFNILEKSTSEPQSKRRILAGFWVCFKSCIWKTSTAKSNHTFFILEKKDLDLTFLAKNILALLKRITDTLKRISLPKTITDIFQCCKNSFSVTSATLLQAKIWKTQPKNARSSFSLFYSLFTEESF